MSPRAQPATEAPALAPELGPFFSQGEALAGRVQVDAEGHGHAVFRDQRNAMISFRGYGTTSGIRPYPLVTTRIVASSVMRTPLALPPNPGSGAVPEYRIYIIGADGDFMQSEAFVRADDTAAIETAKQLIVFGR